MKAKPYQELILKDLKSAQNLSDTQARKRKSYIGTQYSFLGLDSVGEKIAFKTSQKKVPKLSFEQRLTLADQLWRKSKNFHLMNHALQAVTDLVTLCRPQSEHAAILKTTSGWLAHLDNWAHSDGVSKILAMLFSHSRENSWAALVRGHLKLRDRWSKSNHSWTRRQSMVSLLYYSQAKFHTKSKHLAFKQLIALVHPLIEDPEFYVQRGVGWTLREIYNLYPQKTYEYFFTHAPTFSTVAFSAATEKLPKSKKEILKKLRKQARLQ